MRRGLKPFAQTAFATIIAVLLLWGHDAGVRAEDQAPEQTSAQTAAQAPGQSPGVVVSIQPLHSLVAAVMAGVGQPTLLVRGASSPHDYSLTPADARALSRADLVVWTGPALETALARPIGSLADTALILETVEADGVEVLPVRASGAWAAHAGAEAGAEAHDHEAIDGHVWLDPRNAAAIGRAVAAALARRDPAHGARYRDNAEALGAALRDLERELTATLAPVRTTPYIVFHDAYQYFERRFGLNAVGAIAISPDRAPGAKWVAEIRGRLQATNAVCVFTEPQFEPALARTVVEGTAARIATLDPLGVALAPGPAAYGELMRGLAAALRDCLIAPG